MELEAFSLLAKVLIRLMMRKAFNSLTLRPLMLKTTYQAR